MRISDTLLPEFDMEMANTRKCLARIPANKFTFKPHPKSFDMGGLAVHIATMVDWGATTLQSANFDYAPVGGEPYVPPVVKTNAELLALFDSGSAKFRAALAAAENDAMMAPWSLLAGGKTLFTMPRSTATRGMVNTGLPPASRDHGAIMASFSAAARAARNSADALSNMASSSVLLLATGATYGSPPTGA